MISNLTLGTQTFGMDTSKNESFKILDLCFINDIKSIDTAERYPFPEKEETVGLTETIIGEWITFNKIKRKELTLSTKVTGRSENGWKVFGSGRLDKDRIKSSLYNSLDRLKVDYVDIFYFHWPDRYTNTFERKYYEPDPDPFFIKFEEQCEALIELFKEGLIKSIGLSNETPWGIMSFQNILKSKGFRVNYLQNEFSFINRDFERSHSEIALRENINLISYSPLSFGLLTGKYSNSFNIKSQNRLIKYSAFSKRYNTKPKYELANLYYNLCKDEGMDPIHTAIKYGLTKSFLKSVIIGVKSFSQLQYLLRGDYKNINLKTIKKIENELYKILNKY